MRRIIFGVIFSLLLLQMPVYVTPIYASVARMSVTLPSPYITSGMNFTVAFTVTNVTDLFGWQVAVKYNATVVNCTAAWVPEDNVFAGRSTIPVSPVLNEATTDMLNYTLFGLSLISGSLNVSYGVLFKMNFTASELGETTLTIATKENPVRFGSHEWDIWYSYLYDSEMNEMQYVEENGHVTVGPPQKPVAAFTCSITPEHNEVTFNGSESFVPSGYIVIYDWDFGDGQEGNGMIVTHVYTTRAQHLVNLTVTGSGGLTDSVTRTVVFGNLRAVSIEPVQALTSVDLIQDKATDFKIGYESTIDTVIQTNITIEALGFIPNGYEFAYTFVPGNHTFIMGSEIPSSPAFMASNKPDVRFRFMIDPHHSIADVNETDNTAPTSDYGSRRVVDTRKMYILFVAVRFDGEDGYPGYFSGYSGMEFFEHAAESTQYLKAAYPVAQSEVIYYTSCLNAPVNAGPKPATENEASTSLVTLLQKLTERAGNFYDHVVGVVRNDWFTSLPDDPFTTLDWRNTVSFSWKSASPKAVVVRLGWWEAIAHEFGHLSGLADYQGAENTTGYYVEGRQVVNAPTFMNQSLALELTYRKSVPGLWIREDEYCVLENAFRVSGDPETLLVSGTIFTNGSVTLGDWYLFSSGIPDYEEGGSGNYAITEVDSGGNPLKVVNFNVTLAGNNGYSFEVLPFAFTIPYANGTKIIRILNGTGYTLASRATSDNAPTVHVLSPNGGETLTSDHEQVSWEAYDPDSDPLVYSLLVSGDGGLTWNPVATGLNQTTYDLCLTGFHGGNKYLVEVMASDGINTAEDTSDGFFTLGSFTLSVLTSPQIISAGGKVNYTLNIISYGGFNEQIILNASSTTVDGLAFRWINGSAILPVPNASATTILEVEALNSTHGGNFTLILSGVSSNKTETVMSYVFVESHDLSVAQIFKSKNVIGRGFLLILNVTIDNLGNMGEVFSCELHVNQISAAQESVHLPGRGSVTVLLVWNTSDFALDNYTLSVLVEPVGGETNTANNNFADGWVVVSIVGDITGPNGWPDGKCDMRDVGGVARLFGANSPSPQYNPNYDIDDNGKIDMRDIGTVARHFGEHYP